MELPGMIIAGGPIRSPICADPRYWGSHSVEFHKNQYITDAISLEQLEERIELSLKSEYATV